MERLIVLGLGSNKGDRVTYLNNACIHLEAFFNSIPITSSIYETAPVGFESNTYFLNQCVYFVSDKAAPLILEKILAIEKKLGRERIASETTYSSRTIDIDILFIGDEIYDNQDLIVPHPKLQERNFVLLPLAEIVPNLIHPTKKRKVSELLKFSLDKNFVKKKEL